MTLERVDTSYKTIYRRRPNLLMNQIIIFLVGFALVVGTLSSALSTVVLPRAARSQLNRFVFGSLRHIFEIPLRFTHEYSQRDAIMAYYAPIGLMMLIPTWYVLIAIGYAFMYMFLGFGDFITSFQLSSSSLLTLGIVTSDSFITNLFMYSESIIGLILVALLIAYLPTMYSAFSRREQAVTMLEVRAGDPPSAETMLLRFNRIHGLDQLRDYWKNWEIWFSDIEESHSVLPALVFFRSPRSNHSWVTAAGAILDAASITLSAIDIPQEASASLCIRSGYLALRQLADYFDITNPSDPHFPETPISIKREEFNAMLDRLAANNLPVKRDRDQAWQDFGGWRVNYDRVLLALCALTFAPFAPWSSDRALKHKLPPLFLRKKKHRLP